MSLRVLCITSHSDRPEAESFIGMRKAGIDLEVICHPKAPHLERLQVAGVPVTTMELKGRFEWEQIRQIRQRLKDGRYDILHLYNNKAVSNGIFAAYGLPVKIVCYRGIVANVSFYDPASWMTYLHPKVDRIICVAEAIRKYLLDMRLLGMRIPRHRVVTIHKGHDLSWYRDTPADLSGFDIPDGAFVVGCIANIRPRKGIDVLIDAMRHLPEDTPVHLLLVGNMNSDKLGRQIEKSRLRRQIHLTGYRTDAPALMAACDASILPAIKREGLPKAVIEAMVYATPPIVTDSGGSPELIVHGESGLIVPPGDSLAIAKAITTLQQDPEKARQMGERAQQRIASHFRIQDTIDKTIALYREITG